jgi:hypothetical protein
VSTSSGHAGGRVTDHDARTDELRLVMEQTAHPVAVAIVDRVDAELAAMGGDMLATFGGSDDPEDRAMARFGGYLLQRFGR